MHWLADGSATAYPCTETCRQIAPLFSLDATIEPFRTLAMRRFDWRTKTMVSVDRRLESALGYATDLARQVCTVSGDPLLIDDARISLAARGVLEAIRRHDDAVLFDWLMEVLSYQGIADTIAHDYMERHGRINADEIGQGLARKRLCPKLQSYWQFFGCGYRKSTGNCSEPGHIGRCPLPRHSLRNGRLNQTAYSLFLFFRDVAERDFVAWLDRQLSEADRDRTSNLSVRLAESVVEPLTYIYGASNKVVSMSLAALLLAGDPNRPLWPIAGAAMIAVDTLVHNWLHRTGILKRFHAEHLYGPHCYRENSCADIIRAVSSRIDARRFNPSFPKHFPRFVQHAIWQFCAQAGADVCNG